MISPRISTTTTTAIPAATIEFSRAALNLVNQRLRILQGVDDHGEPSGPPLGHCSRPPGRRMGASATEVEWYLRVAGMLDRSHPGFVHTDSDQNPFRLPNNPNLRMEDDTSSSHRSHRVMPTCRQCGTVLFPGTSYTQVRLVSGRRTKPKRRSKCNKKTPTTTTQKQRRRPPPLVSLADHPGLQLPSIKAAKNRLVVTCQLCGFQCSIPAMDRCKTTRTNAQKKTPPPQQQQPSPPVVERQPLGAQKRPVEEEETLDFLPLGGVSLKLPKPAMKDWSLLKKKPKKKKMGGNKSKLHDFLSTLND